MLWFVEIPDTFMLKKCCIYQNGTFGKSEELLAALQADIARHFCKCVWFKSAEYSLLRLKWTKWRLQQQKLSLDALAMCLKNKSFLISTYFCTIIHMSMFEVQNRIWWLQILAHIHSTSIMQRVVLKKKRISSYSTDLLLLDKMKTVITSLFTNWSYVQYTPVIKSIWDVVYQSLLALIKLQAMIWP